MTCQWCGASQFTLNLTYHAQRQESSIHRSYTRVIDAKFAHPRSARFMAKWRGNGTRIPEPSGRCFATRRKRSASRNMGAGVISVSDLFESHLTVADLQRSMAFFGDVLGFELAEVFPQRRVAFYWIGGRGNSMLGLWEVGTGPQKLNLHLAFRSDLPQLLEAPARLRSAGIAPLDCDGAPTEEPVVLAWMPAASLYFRDPDGNLLELVSMLPDVPQPEDGVVPWSRWNQIRPANQTQPDS